MSELGEISLIVSYVKDFDTGLLEQYTGKILHIMHADSLGSTKSSGMTGSDCETAVCLTVTTSSSYDYHEC